MTEILKEYTSGDALLSYFPEVIISVLTDSSVRYGEYFSLLLMATKLPVANQIGMALALYLSDLRELAEVGEVELERKLKEFKALGKKAVDIPERVFEELLFQFSQNSSLQSKLQEEFDYLLESCEATERSPALRIANYLANDCHYFSTEPPVVERPPPVPLKKADLLRDLGPAITATPETLKLILGELGPMSEE